MFIVVKRKTVVKVLIAVILAELCLTAYLCISNYNSNKTSIVDFTVVIDAGHGGIDGGVCVDGVKEADLNLQYAKTLASIFENSGFNVVLTRNNNQGLYGLPTNGFKARDMKARKEIITKSQPNIVISIHMNKFSASYRSGPQVFYQQGQKDGKLLADNLQKVFNDYTGNKHEAIQGDYYMCREVSCPSVIVECGFLSNAQDCQQLQTEDYRNALCNQIFSGVMLYLYSA